MCTHGRHMGIHTCGRINRLDHNVGSALNRHTHLSAIFGPIFKKNLKRCVSLCVLIEMGGGGNVKMNNFIAKKIKIQKATFDATKLPIISSFQATVAWVERENHCIQSLNTFYLSSSCSSYQQQIDPLHFGG